MDSLQIHFLDTSGSEAIEARVRERVEHLSRFCVDIVRCDVWIATPHRHHPKGELHGVRIRLTVPGDEIDIVAAEKEDVQNGLTSEGLLKFARGYIASHGPKERP